MPQLNLLNDRPIYSSVTIHTEDLNPHLDPAWRVSVRVSSLDGEDFTVYAGRWCGFMLDFYTTLHSEVAAAFMFGSLGDLIQVCRDAEKAARRHARAHDRVGS